MSRINESSYNAPRKNDQWKMDKPYTKQMRIQNTALLTHELKRRRFYHEQPPQYKSGLFQRWKFTHVSFGKSQHTTMASFNTVWIFSLALLLIASPFLQGLLLRILDLDPFPCFIPCMLRLLFRRHNCFNFACF